MSRALPSRARTGRALPGRAGFTLVEILVALALISVLMAGMAKVFAAGLEAGAGVQEGLYAQRSLRSAMARVSDDVRCLGYFFPPPGMRPLPVAASALPGLQSAFMLLPDQPLWKSLGASFVLPGPGDDPFEAPGRKVDELSFVLDHPLPVGGTLVEPVPEAPYRISVSADRPLSLEAGDLVWVEDVRFQCARVAEAVSLPGGFPAAVPVVPLEGTPALASHAAGRRVGFVRPLQVLRLAVVYLRLRGTTLPEACPCLVRFETPYPADQAVPRWAELLARPQTLPGSAVVLAENVTGFRVDFSLDGQWPGIRGEDYPSTLGNLNRAIQARYGRSEAATNPLDPLWFRHYPGVVRLTLETRSPVARARGATSRRCFHYETQSFVLTPRNFGLDRQP